MVRQTTNVNFRGQPLIMETFLFHIYIMAIMSCVAQSQHIFSGMDELDQIIEEEITPGGDVHYCEAPYVAAVFNALVKYQTCTGFIVHREFILTAGYCVLRDNAVVDPTFVSVLAGVVDFRDHEMDQWRYAVSINELSKTYKGKIVLVLIRLNEPFYVNFSCAIINYRRRQFGKNQLCLAMSWRFHDKFNRLTLKSLVLKKYHGYVMNKTNCFDVFKSNPVLHGLQDLEFVCMNFLITPNAQDFDCMGADGSSLLCEESGSLYSVGVAVNYFGESKCNRDDVPSVFLDLGAYSQWMDNIIPG